MSVMMKMMKEKRKEDEVISKVLCVDGSSLY